jgi:hypothetical protein
MGISFNHKGNFNKTEKFLKNAQEHNLKDIVSKYGDKGVAALQAATPKDSGLTAESWDYEINIDGNGVTINWVNNNNADGWFNVAAGLQFGHGTGTGGWVEGIDYINPALRPVFDEIAEELWSEIRSW